jgi:hypothetical protein
MKSSWQGSIVDWAAVNLSVAEEIPINEYSDLLQADHDALEWDKEDEQYFEVDSD